MDQETRLVHTSAYTGEITLPPYDFRHMDRNLAALSKNFRFLTVEYFPEGDWNLSCDVCIDGKFMETLTFPMSVDEDSELGTAQTGPTGDAQTLPNTTQTSIRRPLHGNGKRISLRFYQTGSSESFQLASFTIGFEIAGESPVKL